MATEEEIKIIVTETGLDELEAKLKAAENSLENLTNEFERNEDAIQQTKQEIDKYKRAINQATNDQRELNESMHKLGEPLGLNVNGFRELGQSFKNVGTYLRTINPEIIALGGSMALAGAAAAVVGMELARVGEAYFATGRQGQQNIGTLADAFANLNNIVDGTANAFAQGAREAEGFNSDAVLLNRTLNDLTSKFEIMYRQLGRELAPAIRSTTSELKDFFDIADSIIDLDFDGFLEIMNRRFMESIPFIGDHNRELRESAEAQQILSERIGETINQMRTMQDVSRLDQLLLGPQQTTFDLSGNAPELTPEQIAADRERLNAIQERKEAAQQAAQQERANQERANQGLQQQINLLNQQQQAIAESTQRAMDLQNTLERMASAGLQNTSAFQDTALELERIETNLSSMRLQGMLMAERIGLLQQNQNASGAVRVAQLERVTQLNQESVTAITSQNSEIQRQLELGELRTQQSVEQAAADYNALQNQRNRTLELERQTQIAMANAEGRMNEQQREIENARLMEEGDRRRVQQQTAINDSLQIGADLMYQSLEIALTTEKNKGKAVATALRQWMKSFAKQEAFKGLGALAEGIGMTFTNPPAAAGKFQEAGIHFGLAAAAGGGAAGIAAAQGGVGRADRQQEPAVAPTGRQGGGEATGGNVTINIQGQALLTEGQIGREINNALTAYRSQYA